MRRGLVATLGCLAAACSSSANEPLRLQTSGTVRPQDYDSVLARWTRSDEIYQGLDSVLFVHATFHSPEFRRAFLVRHTDVYGTGSEEAQRLLMSKPEAETRHEFFFSAATTNPDWNDFDEADSIWRVTLEGDGNERVPGEVMRLKTNANLRMIYPYVTDYARTYSVRFPLVNLAGAPIISHGTSRFLLRFSSALGEAELSWSIVPGSGSSGPAPSPGTETHQALPRVEDRGTGEETED